MASIICALISNEFIKEVKEFEFAPFEGLKINKNAVVKHAECLLSIVNSTIQPCANPTASSSEPSNVQSLLESQNTSCSDELFECKEIILCKSKKRAIVFDYFDEEPSMQLKKKEGFN